MDTIRELIVENLVHNILEDRRRPRRWGRRFKRSATSSSSSSQGNCDDTDDPFMANKTPSSPPYKGLYVPVDVVHYKYFVDDCHIGDIYMDMGSRSLFIASAAMSGYRGTGSGTL